VIPATTGGDRETVMTDTLRWGILGPGGIARRFADSLRETPDNRLEAVASRSAGRARAFAGEFGAPRAYGSYAELAADPAVDAVYVATPHPQHADAAILALRGGKAVLCEKPLAANLAQGAAMVAVARAEKRVLMEGMWSRFLPVMETVRGWLTAGRIGEIRRIEADFSFRAPFNPASRLYDPALGGGGLLDVGIYALAFARWVMGRAPRDAAGLADVGRSGVDEQAAVILGYDTGAQALLSCGVRTRGWNGARITGDAGSIELAPPFYHADQAILRVGDLEERVTRRFRPPGFQFEIAEFARCVRAGLAECPAMPLDESLEHLARMDRLRASWGVRYPFET
jgi:predicted dehydrogenase